MSDLERAAAELSQARRVVVLTGAGVSKESGIPTFREAMTGLWKNHDPMKLATPEAFERHPALVTRWYDERRVNAKSFEPNPGHVALARLQDHLEDAGYKFDLLTQNVDRLHQRAGSRNVVELHGSLIAWRCTKTGREYEDLRMPFEEYPPPSPDGGILRPSVVWFGEALPEHALQRSYDSLGECDLFMSIGTSSVVFPAAGFIEIAQMSGARTIEINPESTPITDEVDIFLEGPSGAILPRLIDRACPS